MYNMNMEIIDVVHELFDDELKKSMYERRTFLQVCLIDVHDLFEYDFFWFYDVFWDEYGKPNFLNYWGN